MSSERAPASGWIARSVLRDAAEHGEWNAELALMTGAPLSSVVPSNVEMVEADEAPLSESATVRPGRKVA